MGGGGDPTAAAALWKLIDLDAASRVGSGYLGMKSSTLYSPPELLFQEPREMDRRRRESVSEAAGEALGGDAAADVQSTGADGTVYRADGTALSVPGGGGWRVRAVDEDGLPLDTRQAGVFAPLRASVAFDVWSFGAVVYELVRRFPLIVNWLLFIQTSGNSKVSSLPLGETC